MRKSIQRKYLYTLLLIMVASIYGCKFLAPTIASFDQYAYAQTTSLKVDALNMMDLAILDYQSQIKSVTDVQNNLQKLYEYEKNRPKNEATTKQLEILIDPNGHLFGGFVTKWKTDGKLNQTFITEEKKIVGDAFNEIAKLESKKSK